MSSDAQKLWEYIDCYLVGDARKELVSSIQDLKEDGLQLTKEKAERLLEELKKDSLLDSYSVKEDGKIEVCLKMESVGEEEDKTEGKESDTYVEETAEAVEGLYYIDNEFLQSLQESSYLQEAKFQYYRLSGDIWDILHVAGCDKVIAYEDLLQHVLYGINRKIVFSEEGGAGSNSVIATRAFFITGNGGVGKTTLLVMAALDIVRYSDTDVYIVQFKVNHSRDFAKRIIDTVGKSQGAILFVDNPYDNVEAARELIEYVRKNQNIRVVFSERYNRLELIFKDAALISIVNIAGAIVIENQGQLGRENSGSRVLRFVRRENTEVFELSESWKRDVVEKMISYILPRGIKLEDERLQNILKRAVYEASPCEILLQVCLQYNCEVEEERLEAKIPFQFDWDEWKAIFSENTQYALRTEGISLEHVFPFIAALGLYKIPVTVKFVANLVKFNELELRNYLDEKLNGVEPVWYDGEYLGLKHDMIADLYFQAHRREKEPQYYLMQAINYLDEFLIIEYERYVLSAKIIRGKREIPHSSIDTIALFKDFEKHKQYIQCLKTYERFYSYRYAKLYVMTLGHHSSEEVQREWECLLQEVPDEGKLRLYVWISCFTFCMEMNLFPPDIFFSGIDYIDYRIVTDNMSGFKNYVRNGEYDICLYRRIARKTYQVIADRYEKDVPSRLALAEVMVEQDDIRGAEKLLREMLEQDIEDKYVLCVECATLCKKHAMKLDKRNRKKQEERAYYLENAERYYRMALELVQDEKDARPFCAFASFLQRTAGISRLSGTGDKDSIKANRLREAEKYFLKALEIGGNDYSAYNGLAMIYAYVQKWNPYFNPAEAERCYKQAMETCPKSMRVSCYVPWGNFNYDMGNLEVAKEKYEKALQYKQDEIKAIRAIELIEEEQDKLERLLQEKPQKIKKFEQLYCKRQKKRGVQSRVLNKSLFQEETTQREILRLVYSALRSEEVTPQILKNCKKAMTNLSYIGGIDAGEDAMGFLYLRIAQYLQICCEQCGEEPYLDLERQKVFAHMAFLRHRKVVG